MPPEEKELLSRSVALEEDNNRMLHKIRSVQRWSAFWSSLKILLIIGIAFGSFYFLEPYMNKIISIWDYVSGNQQKLDGTPVQDFLKKLGN